MKKLDFQIFFFAFIRIFSSSLVKLSCYKPYKLYTPYKSYKLDKPFKLYKHFINLTNFLLEGMESSVLQTFYKPTIFTNLLQTLQTLQTFYKLFPRRYRILCFTNFLQTLQTVQSLQTFCSKV